MATDSASCLKMVRVLALLQIVIGSLLFIFGIVDRLVGDFWTGYGYFGIWTGIWLCITGSLGIPGSSRERNSRNNAFNGVFMGFSITSAVFGGITIICYSISLSYYDHFRYGSYRYYGRDYDASLAIAALVLVLGIVNFVCGIWAAVGSCYICNCCGNGSVPAQQVTQMAYVSNPNAPAGGYIMQQGPGGVPMAVPVQGGGMVAVQMPTSAAAMGSHPQVVQVPTSMAMGSYPQMVPISTSGATGGPPQFVQYAGASGAMMGADQSQAEQIAAKQ